jgi:hypothetical protein
MRVLVLWAFSNVKKKKHRKQNRTEKKRKSIIVQH